MTDYVFLFATATEDKRVRDVQFISLPSGTVRILQKASKCIVTCRQFVFDMLLKYN